MTPQITQLIEYNTKFLLQELHQPLPIEGYEKGDRVTVQYNSIPVLVEILFTDTIQNIIYCTFISIFGETVKYKVPK